MKQMKWINLSIVALLLSVSSCKDKEETIVVEKNDNTYAPERIRPILEEQQKKIFGFFYDGAGTTSGLALEGDQRGDVVTIGGGGFGVMALIVGSERNWITRAQAAERTQKIVRFLGKAERYKGVWSHWYNPDGTSHAFGDQVKCGDMVETAFMVAGLLAASEYYTGNTSVEKEIRDSVASFWNTIDWRFYTNGQNVLNWLYYSQENRLTHEIRGWNEGWECYIFALAAPEPHNISPQVYQEGWFNNNSFYNPNLKTYGYELPFGGPYGGPLFFTHYSFLGFDPRKIEDEKAHYWRQNVGQVMINRHYCIEEAPKEYKYNERTWGLTACYGAGSKYEYWAREPKYKDDGVIAPTAALASYPYTPFYSTQVLLNLVENHPGIQGTYGIGDSYRPSETGAYEKKHLAIDQGPIVVMIENYRSGLIWDLLMKNEHARKGLELAGVKAKPDFKEGYQLAISNTKTSEYDMMRHPDRMKYEIDYFVEQGGKVKWEVLNSLREVVLSEEVTAAQGENIFRFDNDKIKKGKAHTLRFTSASGKSYTLAVRLR